MSLNRAPIVTAITAIAFAATPLVQAQPAQSLTDALFAKARVVGVPPVLPIGDRAAIAALLPLRVVGGQVVDAVCRQDAQPEVTLLDLNDDRQTEVLVSAGNACIDGLTGSSIFILAKSGLEWRVVLHNAAIDYRLLNTHGIQGWRDVLLLGRSPCFGRWRFNGQEYDAAGGIDERGNSCK